jgi:hypothetical protein
LGWVAEDKFGGKAADGDVSAADGVKEGGVGRGAERARDICGEGSVFFKVRDGGSSGLMEKADIRETKLGVCGGVGGGGGGGMWSRHTISLACLEPTRTSVASPGANIESEVGVRRYEPEICRKGEIARSECERMESGADQKSTGNGRRGK